MFERNPPDMKHPIYDETRFTDTETLELLRRIVLDNIPRGDIYPSHIHGYGLFANMDIPAGTVLCFMDGQIMNWHEYNRSVKLIELFGINNDQPHPLFLEWNCLGTGSGMPGPADDTMLMVRPFRTKYSFVNHSRTPNCKIQYNPLRLVSTKDIKQGEEFTFDYRTEPLPQEYYDEHGETYL